MRHGDGAGTGDLTIAGPLSNSVIGVDALDIVQTPPASQAQDRQAQREAALQTLAALAELYPACFVADKSKPHRPLKRGMHRDLIDRGILRPEECRLVFLLYVTRRQYQKALAAGGPRVDLDGNAVGEVAADEIEHARAVVAQMEAKVLAQAEAARIEKAERKRVAKQAKPKAPPPDSPAPRRLGLAALKAAAAARRNGGAL